MSSLSAQSLQVFLPTSLFCVIIFAMGILFTLTTSYLYVVGSLMLLVFYATRQKGGVKLTLLLFLFFCAGATRCLFQKKHHNTIQKQLCGKKISIYGTIQAIEKTKKGYLRKAITLSFNSIKHNKKKVALHGTIKIYTNTTGELSIGDVVIIKNLFIKKPPNKNFDDFLIKQQINATAFASKIEYTLIHRPIKNVARYASQKKMAIYDAIKQKCNRETFSFFSSLFLGNKNENYYTFEKIKQQFRLWGVLHFAARSGLHLVICIALWNALLNLLFLPFLVMQALLILLAILYCIMSWSSVSFLRALTVFFLYKIAPFFKKRTHTMHLLSITCFLMLLANPIRILFLDFQLTFLLTYALVWFGQQKKFAKKLLL